MLLYRIWLIYGALACCCTQANSQKEYHFDYMLQYDTIQADATKVSTTYVFVSTKDNSAVLSVWEQKDKVVLQLIDANAKVYRDDMLREDFFVLAIAMRCPITMDFASAADYSDYTWAGSGQTIQEGKPLQHVVLEVPNKKAAEKRNIGATHYLYEAHPDFKKPAILPFALLYHKWKAGGRTLSGIIKEEQVFDAKGQILKTVRLANVLKLDKVIIVDTNCKK